MIDAMIADDMIRGDTMSMEVAISWQWLFSLMSNGKSKPLEVLGFPGCWMEIWRKWKFDGFESCTVHDWSLLRRKNQFYGNRKESTTLKSNVIGFSRCWMIMEKSQWFGRVWGTEKSDEMINEGVRERNFMRIPLKFQVWGFPRG